ncbi:Crp/Fnr family transcriptional regulator [Metabacillus malikii]|uniref:CRP/FNR family transcriptional regulator n=1 Tax=Metabacillus malikii TaxID=1504265 RepID=A0ABT9ZNW8_9BACI|nr:Crp/Fnr family transcriptional regulator [Metabacillus malikii]MDQ0233481.1 CRP/FNR family transcriptional regulator [Metabacillus malikii]
MTQHHICSHSACVTHVPIFNHLEPEQMTDMMKLVQSGTYKKGELLFHPEEKTEALYIVNKGKMKIYHLSEAGKEQLVRILGRGDFTGELALFQHSTQKNYAEAMVDTQVCFIHKSDLQNLLLKYPSISIKILEEFANRLEVSEKQTTRFTTEKVETRLAHFLTECIEEDNEEIELPISKKDIASYLGTTPETISRALKNFEEQGFIIRISNKRLKILDLDGLLLMY